MTIAPRLAMLGGLILLSFPSLFVQTALHAGGFSIPGDPHAAERLKQPGRALTGGRRVLTIQGATMASIIAALCVLYDGKETRKTCIVLESLVGWR